VLQLAITQPLPKLAMSAIIRVCPKFFARGILENDGACPLAVRDGAVSSGNGDAAKDLRRGTWREESKGDDPCALIMLIVSSVAGVCKKLKSK